MPSVAKYITVLETRPYWSKMRELSRIRVAFLQSFEHHNGCFLSAALFKRGKFSYKLHCSKKRTTTKEFFLNEKISTL